MNIRKTTVAALVASASVASFAAVPEVTSVTMSQPSNSRLVTITYTLADAPGVVTLDVQTNATADASADDPGWASIGGKAVCNAEGDVWKKIEPGSHTITWRPDLSWPDHKIADNRARAVVTAWATNNTPDYMAIDISAAATAATEKKYYPGADYVPGGVTNSLYKTTMLLMRKIMAKGVTWTMGSTEFETQRVPAAEKTFQVTLTNNYYIGVYEFTKTQWLLLKSDWMPNWFTNLTDRAMRPVDNMCFTHARGTNYYPDPPTSTSVLGKLQTKTGFFFDYPSEAQWEFAARAGNGSTKWGDGSGILNSDEDENMSRLGRYKYNGGLINGTDEPDQSCGATNGTAIVGAYEPNAWGLYDMFGNVWEICLDKYVDDISTNGGNVNPLGSALPSQTANVKRGGAYDVEAKNCRSAKRSSDKWASGNKTSGFRVVTPAGLQ